MPIYLSMLLHLFIDLFFRYSIASLQPKRIPMKTKVFLILSVLALTSAVIVISHFSSRRHDLLVMVGPRTVAKVNLDAKELTILNLHGDNIIKISLDAYARVKGSFSFVEQFGATKDKGLKWRWTNSSLTISAHHFNDVNNQPTLHCVKIGWKTSDERIPNDCIHFPDVSTKFPDVWYGSHDYIFWHSNASQVGKSNSCISFIPGAYSAVDPFGKVIKNSGGNVIEPLWFSSNGVAVKASNRHNVRVCREFSPNPRICMEPLFDPTHQDSFHHGAGFHLDYAVCVAESLPVLYEGVMKALVKPDKTSINKQTAFNDIINGGAYFEDQVTQNATTSTQPTLVSDCRELIEKPLWNMEYRRSVVDKGFIYLYLGILRKVGGTFHLKNFSLLYTHLGDFQLRNDPHHDNENFLTVARELGINFMLPVTPFINFDSLNFAEGAVHEYFIKNAKSDAPLLISFDFYRPQFPAIVDVTSSKASHWFISLIEHLKLATNVSLFHFYFGQSSWLPRSSFHLSRPLHNIGHFSTLFADLALKSGRCTITDVAYDIQNLNQFVLLSPFPSMKETLAGVLAAGMAGYPFVIANFPCPVRDAARLMDPGVLENGIIRWVEMVSFFPVVHIPWDFMTYITLIETDSSLPELITNVTRRFMAVRNSAEVAPKLKKAFLDAELNGTKPVVAPMWMAPNALIPGSRNYESLLLIDDQFMIGPDMFVAPVLDAASTSRNIYVPPGKWKDVVCHRDTKSSAGKWLRNYKVDLMKIPVFVRTDSII